LAASFDRRNDRYLEHITPAYTREVLRHVEEPLSAHRGHGSAKKPKAN
jgi:hypothetical protein